jgi:hypothetical protein
MGFQQQVVEPNPIDSESSPLADAAGEYQRHREIEARQLALMAQHNLLEEWTPEVQATVLTAREHIRAARTARAIFRAHIRQFVRSLRSINEPLSVVLHKTRSMLLLLERCGAIRHDGGWLEAEVLEWAIGEYENRD